jgi:hypothetical protein
MREPDPARRGTCTYCGKLKPLTVDHVPPKNLFSKPFPPNLWTIPACAACNGKFSKDVEYFRVALTISDRAKGQTSRDVVLPTVIRGLNRSEARRFRPALLANSAVLPRYSSGGLYLGHQRLLSFDGARLDRTAERIIKGLSFKVKGHRLPDDHTISVVYAGRFRQLMDVDPEVELALREFLELLGQEPLTQIGDAFSFRWIQSPNGADHSMWLLYFFGNPELFCTTYALSSIANTTLEAEIARVRTTSKF